MSRAVVTLYGKKERAQAAHLIATAPPLTRVDFKGPRRSNDQNSLMWCLLTEVASQLEWHGQKYTPDDWKDYGMHALKRARWMPSEDGGMVPIGMRTSDLSKAEMGELIEFLYAFGASHGVTFSEPSETNGEGGSSLTSAAGSDE